MSQHFQRSPNNSNTQPINKCTHTLSHWHAHMHTLGINYTHIGKKPAPPDLLSRTVRADRSMHGRTTAMLRGACSLLFSSNNNNNAHISAGPMANARRPRRCCPPSACQLSGRCPMMLLRGGGLRFVRDTDAGSTRTYVAGVAGGFGFWAGVVGGAVWG